LRGGQATFPSAAHLVCWAGLCPGTHESAGQRKGGKTRKGSRWLRALLVVAAQAAERTKTTAFALGTRFRALTARRGGKRAAGALSSSTIDNGPAFTQRCIGNGSSRP
jgi:transposase